MNNFKYMVFGGGGAAGYAFVGALKQLAKQPEFSFSHIQGVAGTSVGAVAALVVSLNYPLEEASEKLAAIDLKKLADSGCILSNANRLFTQYGMYKGLGFSEFINTLIKERTGRDDPENVTFADLKALGCKDLYIVTTKLYTLNGTPTGKQKIFSTEKTPNTSVAAAIRASAAAPFYFARIRLKKEEKGKYIIHEQGDLYEDGGILNNFPIELFDQAEYCPAGQKSAFNHATLGVALYSPKNDKNMNPIKEKIGDSNPQIYVHGLVNSLLHQVNHTKLNEAMNIERTIRIDRNNIRLNDFNMSEADKQKLIASGEEAVKHFFDTYQIKLQAKNDREFNKPSEPIKLVSKAG